MMKTTFTNNSLVNWKVQDIQEAAKSLNKGGIVLCPADSVWCLIADATNSSAIEKLRQMDPEHAQDQIEVLVQSIESLKEHLVMLHPRLETLLFYHTRPLTILFDDVINLPKQLLRKDELVAMRLVRDEYSQQLLTTLGKPIAARPAGFGLNHFPTSLGAVSSEIIEKADYIVKYKQKERGEAEPAIVVRLGEGDELEFLRE